MPPISLASRFLVTLVATAILPLLAYGWFSLRSMRAQIDEQVVRVFLPQLAADHAQKIEAALGRVDQSCAVVREIARRALDSAVEMAAFAEQIELVPDLLDNHLDLLMLADAEGRVVYWQDGQRLDPNAHERRAALIPATSPIPAGSSAPSNCAACSSCRGGVRRTCTVGWSTGRWIRRATTSASCSTCPGRPGRLACCSRWPAGRRCSGSSTTPAKCCRGRRTCHRRWCSWSGATAWCRPTPIGPRTASCWNRRRSPAS